MLTRNTKWVTAGLMVGLLVAALDQTIVDTAFPRMIADLHGESIFTWVITLYMLASTAIVPVVGKMADIYGRKVFFLSGLALFVIGSMLCGLAQSMLQLILFRGLQGIGAGMLIPTAFTIVGDLFPGEQRARMQGFFGGVWGLASILGPKLGGWITHNYSWRWIFYINLPIGLAALIIMSLVYKESRGEQRPIDWMGSLTITSGIVLFLLAVAKGGKDWAWGSWQSFTLFGLSVALIGIFLAIERRVPEPVLDLRLFRNRAFSVMSVIGLLMGAGMFGAVVFVPWFIQGVVGVNPDQAGNVMTPMMMAAVISSVIAGRIAMRFAYRYQLTIGFLMVAVGYFTMTRWDANTTQMQATLSSMVVGAGLGQIMPLLTLVVQNAFPANRRGVVTSASAFFRQIGGTLGVTLFGALFNQQMSAHFQERVAPVLTSARTLLAGLPPQAQAFLVQVQQDPQILVRVLLSEEIRAAIPAPIRAPFVAAIKEIMSTSLHTVFWTGIGVVLTGTVVCQLIGNINLKQQVKEMGTQAAPSELFVAD